MECNEEEEKENSRGWREMSGNGVKFMKPSSQNMEVTKEVKITQVLSLEEQVKKEVSSSDKQTKKSLRKDGATWGHLRSKIPFFIKRFKEEKLFL